MQTLPKNLIIATALALLPMPAVLLLDALNRDCGDGMCSFIPGLVLLGGLAIATLVFLVRSSRRSETRAIFRLAPIALWAAALGPMLL